MKKRPKLGKRYRLMHRPEKATGALTLVTKHDVAWVVDGKIKKSARKYLGEDLDLYKKRLREKLKI